MQKFKGMPIAQVTQLERRANCKIVSIEKRHFVIGGMTAEQITNKIYEFRINTEQQQQRIQWKQVYFENNLFAPRNSYTACAANGLIYIWGGLQLTETQQTCLSDLIELDIEKRRMRLIPLKQKIKIHSSSLLYDDQTDELIGYGGSDANSNLPAYLYRLKLTLQENQKEYEWIKVPVKCHHHQGYIWQHSAHISTQSFFNQNKGKFLTVIGGCRFSHSPYKYIVEIDLTTYITTNQILLDQGLVSHDSVVKDGKIYIFGGSNGGDFNCILYILQKGQIHKLKGHRAVGCSCCLIQNSVFVLGGVSGPQTINGCYLYT